MDGLRRCDRMAVMRTATIELTGDRVEPADVIAVARHGVAARLSDEARAAMAESAAVVERLAGSDRPVYGVSTGFGSLAGTWIPPERREELQRALIRSHAAGMGPPIDREAVRAMMFLRARSLAMGRSGARPIVADTMLALLAAGLDPGGPRAWVARCERRSRSPRSLRPRSDGRGRGLDGCRGARPGGGRAGRGVDRAAHADRQGGARPDQRHGRHPRDAAAGPPRRGAAAQDGGHHGRHVDGGAARHRPRVRRRPRGHAPPARPGVQRRQPHAAARRAPRSWRATATTIRVFRTRTRSAALRR